MSADALQNIDNQIKQKQAELEVLLESKRGIEKQLNEAADKTIKTVDIPLPGEFYLTITYQAAYVPKEQRWMVVGLLSLKTLNHLIFYKADTTYFRSQEWATAEINRIIQKWRTLAKLIGDKEQCRTK